MQDAESDAAEIGPSPQGAARKPEATRLRPQQPVLDLTATEVEPERAGAAPETPAADDAGAPSASAAAEPPHSTESTAEPRASQTASTPGPDVMPADPPVPPPRRTGLLPAMVCGAAAGALVAVAAVWLGGFDDQRQARDTAAGARLSRLEAEVTALTTGARDGGEALRIAKQSQTQIAALQAALKALPTGTDPALARQIGSLGETANTMQAQIADLRKQLGETTGVATAARDAALRSAGSSSAVATTAAGEVGALTKRAQALETAVQALQARANAPARDDAARFAALALALRVAVERGDPYAADLAALEARGVDPTRLAPLRAFAASGVPSAASLTQALTAALAAAAAPAKPPAAAPATGDESVIARLRQVAGGLVRITPAGAPSGPSSDALATLRSAAARGDLAGAAAAAGRLPDAQRKLLAPWVAKVEARNAALAAAQSLAQQGLAALSQTHGGPDHR